MKKILLISGSPREGNTEYILSGIQNSLGDVSELILLRNLSYNHCRGCLACYETGECVQCDDMKKIFNKLLKADLIVIGSPLYYGNVSGLMKSFIDRTIPAYEKGLLKDKKLISIMVGGGEIETTAKFHKEAIRGFVKYNKLKLLKVFNFQGFGENDLKDDPSATKEISKIIKLIKL